MPEIFSKKCKVNVIQYGEHCKQGASFGEVCSGILSYIKTIFKP